MAQKPPKGKRPKPVPTPRPGDNGSGQAPKSTKRKLTDKEIHLKYKRSGPPMKPSPAKGKIWDAVKRTGEKVYDKASQIGMGIKNLKGNTSRDEWYNAKKAYNKEKKADEAMRKREAEVRNNKKQK